MEYNYIVYKTKNLINDKIYVGVHKQIGVEFDGYLGSGKAFRRSVTYYGESNFIRETLHNVTDSELAYFIEKTIVTKEFIKLDTNYNLKEGGIGGDTGVKFKPVHTKESYEKRRLTMISKYGSITGQLRTKEVQDKRNKKSLETYGTLMGQCQTKESREKAKITSINKYGSNQGHLRSKKSLESRKLSNKKKFYNSNPELNTLVQLMDEENNIVYENTIYEMSILIHGSRRGYSYSSRIINKANTGRRYPKSHKYPYHKIIFKAIESSETIPNGSTSQAKGDGSR